MFESVFGHRNLTQILEKMVENQAIPNSLCFHGVDGIGKRKVARELAQAMFCETRNACGHCSPCMKFKNKTLPDFMEIGPEGREIKVAAIRNITEQIHFKPFETSYRIFLLDQVESMNEGAANAFLKSLEEPPEYVFFFLVTSDLDKLLPTIRSRCQKFAFQPLEPAEKERILAQAFQLDPTTAFNLAHISFRQLETDPEAWDVFKEHTELILSFFKTMVTKGFALDFFNAQLRSRENQARFLDHFLACLRELMFQTVGQTSNPVFEPWKDTFHSLAAGMDPAHVTQAMDDVLYQMRNQARNLNWTYWFNSFGANALGLAQKTEQKHRDWLVKKGKFSRWRPASPGMTGSQSKA